MTTLERHNQREIDRLNQRGGRMLSLVDLLEAGTVGLDMAAHIAGIAARGGSFLTAAGPGGVGKTTLMGAVLAFLPPGTAIVPVDSSRTLDRLPPPSVHEPRCLVVHEIGNGSYDGYLWGSAVGRYAEAARPAGRCLASNLHAETYQEATRQLRGLDVTAEALAAIDCLAFMAVAGGKRRVTTVWIADGAGSHRCAWRWDAGTDTFEPTADPANTRADEAVIALRRFLAAAQASGVHRMDALRRQALGEVFNVNGSADTGGR